MSVPTSIFRNNNGKLSRWRLGVRIAIPLSFAIVGFGQTSFFGRFLPGFDHATIRRHVKECKQLQYVRSERGSPDRIEFESFKPDNPELEQRLRTAIKSFTEDVRLNEVLKKQFEEDFNDLNVIIIPSWVITSKEKADLYGITVEGWSHIDEARNTDYVGAYTLRDRPNEGKVTKDGKSRILINPSAFQSESALRFTLFHEMLHALNIPGKFPPWYCFAQDDLRYLPEYRDEVARRGWISFSQLAIWILAVLVPLGIAFAQIIYAYGSRKARNRDQSP